MNDQLIDRKHRKMEKELKDLGNPTEEKVHVIFPEQTISPKQFNNYRIGNVSFETVRYENETSEEAYERAWDFVTKMARERIVEIRKIFWEAYSGRESRE